MANPALYNRFCTRWGGPPSGVCCFKNRINIINCIHNILHKLNSSPRYYKYTCFSVKPGFILISWINFRKTRYPTSIQLLEHVFVVGTGHSQRRAADVGGHREHSGKIRGEIYEEPEFGMGRRWESEDFL